MTYDHPGVVPSGVCGGAADGYTVGGAYVRPVVDNDPGQPPAKATGAPGV
eukprot:gene8945-1674_t